MIFSSIRLYNMTHFHHVCTPIKNIYKDTWHCEYQKCGVNSPLQNFYILYKYLSIKTQSSFF